MPHAKKRKPAKGSAPAPRVVPGTGSRPPLARMIRIHERLQEQAAHPGRTTAGPLNCATLGEDLEVNPKTIQRDLDFMRDRLGLPIDYDAVTRGYRYSRPVAQFPSVQITEGELIALAVARQALGQYRGTPFERPLRAAFHKLTAGLRDQIQFAWFSDGEDGDPTEDGAGGDAAAISFRSAAAGRGVVTDLAGFEAASGAVLRGEEVEFLYRKLDAAGPSRRRVRPLHLACIDGGWYLFGLDALRTEMPLRTFALSRMAELRPTGERFERPAKFSLEEHLANSFGVFAPAGPPVEVRLRFDPFAARLVQERTWHASQRLSPRPGGGGGGGVDLTLRVSLSPEVERWVLGWGEHVEVLAPVDLRVRIATVAGAVARTHGMTTAAVGAGGGTAFSSSPKPARDGL